MLEETDGCPRNTSGCLLDMGRLEAGCRRIGDRRRCVDDGRGDGLLFLPLPKAAACHADARTQTAGQSTHSPQPRTEGAALIRASVALAQEPLEAGSRRIGIEDGCGALYCILLLATSRHLDLLLLLPKAAACHADTRKAHSWASRLHSLRTAQSHVPDAPPSFARRWHRRGNPTFGDPDSLVFISSSSLTSSSVTWAMDLPHRPCPSSVLLPGTIGSARADDALTPSVWSPTTRFDHTRQPRPHHSSVSASLVVGAGDRRVIRLVPHRPRSTRTVLFSLGFMDEYHSSVSATLVVGAGDHQVIRLSPHRPLGSVSPSAKLEAGR
ncbi:hypothetical protein B0H13DRAFT_2318451 [Mycena leptocephala]|nr:hypothetical protein B0H13DRAFT_2318451 [Mycena leptocephala]